MPSLTLVRGTPGTGGLAYVQRLADEQANTVVLDIDAFQPPAFEGLSPTVQPTADAPLVFPRDATAQQLAAEQACVNAAQAALSQGQNVIVYHMLQDAVAMAPFRALQPDNVQVLEWPAAPAAPAAQVARDETGRSFLQRDLQYLNELPHPKRRGPAP